MRQARYVVSVSFDDADTINTACNAPSFSQAVARAAAEWPEARSITARVILEGIGETKRSDTARLWLAAVLLAGAAVYGVAVLWATAW